MQRKHTQNPSFSINIPMCAALVLLCLTLISVHLTSGLYAKYTATATGSGSARVAKFEVDCTVEQATDEDGNAIEGQFTLTVENHSEVAIKYSVNVNYTAPMSVSIDNGESKSPETGESSVTFTDEAWILAPGETTSSHSLQFAVTNWVGLTDPNEDRGKTEEVPFAFNISVTAEQVD